MNIFLVIVLLILFGTMIWGYWRGFIRIAFSLMAMVLNIMLVSWTTPFITDFLKENTNIYENMVEQYAQQIQISAEKEIEDIIERTKSHKQEKNKKVEEMVQGIPFSGLWLEEILEKTDSITNSVADKTQVYRKMGEYMADWVLRGITFLITLLVTSFLIKLLLSILNIVEKLPLLKGVNRLLGGIVGVLQGLLIVWLLFFLVTVFCTTQIGQSALSYINASEFLTFLYQYNGVLYFFNYVFA